jgi:hypothetical protein
MLELPWSDDISRPLTCIHSRSERWISGQSLRHDSPSWPADMHIIRGGGLGWAETWSWAPLSESSQPLAEPGLGARLPTPSGAHARELDHQRSARVNRWELVCGCIS